MARSKKAEGDYEARATRPRRAFNLRLRRRLDQAGLELSMPRLNVQLSRAPKAKSAEPDEQGTPADGGI